MNYNIDLDYENLNVLIQKMKKENEEIIDSLDNIYNELSKVDDMVWSSKEKKKLDNGFIPYIKESSESLKSDLEDRLVVLNFALNLYKDRDLAIENATKDLEVL